MNDLIVYDANAVFITDNLINIIDSSYKLLNEGFFNNDLINIIESSYKLLNVKIEEDINDKKDVSLILLMTSLI